MCMDRIIGIVIVSAAAFPFAIVTLFQPSLFTQLICRNPVKRCVLLDRYCLDSVRVNRVPASFICVTCDINISGRRQGDNVL